VSESGRSNGLQDLVLTRLRELGTEGEPMSALQAVAAADGLVSYESLRSIARGLHGGRLGARTAEGLAKALRVPIERVYAAAGVPAPSGPWDWPRKFERLSPRQRELVEQIAAALLESYEQGRRDVRDTRGESDEREKGTDQP
jgi:hypothetical protein